MVKITLNIYYLGDLLKYLCGKCISYHVSDIILPIGEQDYIIVYLYTADDSIGIYPTIIEQDENYKIEKVQEAEYLDYIFNDKKK
jgi:hypothetical protein